MKGRLMAQVPVTQTARKMLTETVIQAKAERQLSWAAIAANSGLSREFVTAALLGQHPLPASAAEAVGETLGLAASEIGLLQAIPIRG